jgi:hypothetical protein
MRANDGAVAITKPPTIRDRLLNMTLTPVEPFHEATMRGHDLAVKPRRSSFTAL